MHCLKADMKHREGFEYLDNKFPHICYYPTGSRYMCYPPPDKTDEDYVVLVKHLHVSKVVLEMDGWKMAGDYVNDDTEFLSFKKKEDGILVNLIVTPYDDFYQQWIAATEDCKERNLLDKNARIKLFDDYLNYRI